MACQNINHSRAPLSVLGVDGVRIRPLSAYLFNRVFVSVKAVEHLQSLRPMHAQDRMIARQKRYMQDGCRAPVGNFLRGLLGLKSYPIRGEDLLSNHNGRVLPTKRAIFHQTALPCAPPPICQNGITGLSYHNFCSNRLPWQASMLSRWLESASVQLFIRVLPALLMLYQSVSTNHIKFDISKGKSVQP